MACLLSLMLGPAVQPASAYVCGRAPQQTRALQGHVGTLKDCDRPASRLKRGNADPMSFVFFIGIMAAVVLVPITLGRREELPPQ